MSGNSSSSNGRRRKITNNNNNKFDRIKRIKRGGTNLQQQQAASLKQNNINDDDESIDSLSEDDFDTNNNNKRTSNNNQDDDEDEENEETVDEKRVRLARQYLQQIQQKDDDDDSSSEDDEEDEDEEEEYDRIGARLQRERFKQAGTLERPVAHIVQANVQSMYSKIPTATTTTPYETFQSWSKAGLSHYLRGHDLTVTSVALSADGVHAVSGSKDHSVILWDVTKQCRIQHLCPKHNKKNDATQQFDRQGGQVLSVACSENGHLVAVGRQDATVTIYDVRTKNNNIAQKILTGHKGPITSIVFRNQSLDFFSASEDRCIRHYTCNTTSDTSLVDNVVYMETLYGHQAAVMDMDVYTKERPISVGRDRTARAWKLAQDSHLIYRTTTSTTGGAPDCCTMLNNDVFASGHDDGTLHLWHVDKKRPMGTIALAHGCENNNTSSSVGRGICSLGALKGSDMIVSGSNDGFIRLWKARSTNTRKKNKKQLQHENNDDDNNNNDPLQPLTQIPIHGFVNDIAVGPKAKFCVVALGQEPRLGRWSRVPRAKNRFGIIPLITLAQQEEEHNDDD